MSSLNNCIKSTAKANRPPVSIETEKEELTQAMTYSYMYKIQSTVNFPYVATPDMTLFTNTQLNLLCLTISMYSSSVGQM